MSREKLIAKLLAEIPELLGDYEHCALDERGKLDPARKQRIKRVSGLLFKINNFQSIRQAA